VSEKKALSEKKAPVTDHRRQQRCGAVDLTAEGTSSSRDGTHSVGSAGGRLKQRDLEG